VVERDLATISRLDVPEIVDLIVVEIDLGSLPSALIVPPKSLQHRRVERDLALIFGFDRDKT